MAFLPLQCFALCIFNRNNRQTSNSCCYKIYSKRISSIIWFHYCEWINQVCHTSHCFKIESCPSQFSCTVTQLVLRCYFWHRPHPVFEFTCFCLSIYIPSSCFEHYFLHLTEWRPHVHSIRPPFFIALPSGINQPQVATTDCECVIITARSSFAAPRESNPCWFKSNPS